MLSQAELPQYLESVYSRLKPELVFEGTFNHNWQKAGPKWRGKCPWHESKSGTAFYLDTKSLTWRCPHCDRGGGAIQYLHQIRGGAGSPKGKQFLDLARELGQLVGIDLPEQQLTPEQQEAIAKIENRRSMLETVVAFCHRCLMEESTHAIAYLIESRGFTLDELKALHFGAFPSANRVAKVLTDNGFTLVDAIECGLLYETQTGAIGSTLEGYITIPWHDEHGRILTIYGRWHSKTPPEGRPKTTALRNPGTKEDPWLRSKKSPLYLDRAIAANHRDVVVVEGVLDAALLQMRGDTRAIAWVAANPSADQINTLVKCKIDTVTFCLDPDGAGDKGTRQGIKRLTEAGIKTYAAPVLPDGLDPDEYVVQHGIDQWFAHIDQRIHGFRFEAQKIIANHQPLTDSALQSALEEAEAFAKCVPDSLRTGIEPFFWQEFRQVSGVVVGNPQPIAELKAAVSQLAQVVDPFERVMAENRIGDEFKIRGARLERLLHHHEAQEKRKSVLSAGDVANGLFAKVEERARTGIPLGYRCGFLDLDAMTQGFQRGDLIVVAGRTSMGKTAFVGNLMTQMAEMHGLPMLIFSMEMEAERLMNRLVSAECRIDTGRIITGRIQNAEWDTLALAIAKIANLPIYIDESPSPSIEDIEHKAKTVKAEHQAIGGIFIDHLQFMDHSGEFRAQEIAKITKRLKVLARELDCPVFALSQINRGVESRDNKRPNNSDLKDSGGIEQDADLVLMLYRDEYYRSDTPDRGIAEVIVTKHRNGPTGTVKLLFESQFSRFRNLAKNY